MLNHTTDNTVLLFDSYKYSHPEQISPGTEFVYCYIESRGGLWDSTLFFGLQMFLQRYLAKPITTADIDEAEEVLRGHGQVFDRSLWDHIVAAHDGRFPLHIKAVAEGTLVPGRNVLATVVNTDPACFWLPGLVETALQRAVWYPTTVATNSFEGKVAILQSLYRTSDDPEGQIGFKLHDFGARGVSSHESAQIGGAAHLVNFLGTDTTEALLPIRRCYGEPIAGFSIPAAEHLTITSWGREREEDAYRNMLRRFGKPGAMFAVVVDSYDLEHAVCELWGRRLKNELIASGAKVVIRPDSGDPLTIPIQVERWLADAYGTRTNGKGFEVLHPSVGVIQGDGIKADTLPKILVNSEAAGFSTDNLAFGMGGGLLQQVDRDTLRFAQKASAVYDGDGWRDVYKDPKTDPGKRSKAGGRFALVQGVQGPMLTVPYSPRTARLDLLQAVYVDGALAKQQRFSDIRALAHAAAVEQAQSRAVTPATA